MQAPDDEPFVPYPNRIPPDPAGLKIGKTLRSLFKKAKAALTGDEGAQEAISDAAANTVIKTADTIGTAGKATYNIVDKTGKKIGDACDKKAKPPTP